MKVYNKIALISIAATLASCSAEDAVKMDNSIDAKQYITIKVSDAKSRAGRELNNIEPGQNIENLKIVLVDNTDKIIWVAKYDKWNTSDAIGGSTLSDDQSYREKTIEIPKSECRLVNGENYHIYAYGYSNDSDYDMTPVETLSVGNQFASDVQLTLADGKVGEEIFAGDCLVAGNTDGFNANVVLNRQVAGAFGYLTKIPYVTDAAGHVGTYLILTASNPQKSITLGQFDNSAAGVEYNGKNVISGTTNNETKIIYTINLNDWFYEIKPSYDENGRSNNVIAGGDNWKGNASYYKDGSVYGGNFLVPFAKVDGTATFTLSLCYDDDLSTVMRAWDVLLPASASQLLEYSLLKHNGSAWTSETDTDSFAVYNVLRNRLYGIGVKATGELSAGTPDDPTDDPQDEPLPINNKQELFISVNGEWNSIYNMGVE